ncbi:MAG: ROK family protein [Actinophytocola sp.]|uniref:ROK family transcriptional regulator n=1 Tax=Actinophytocola sp. TaxID=1872138 RepID=UPI001325E57B|nr:ROK family transcriptional regulator [Actinophytocola sp.]MPZ85447.1 ROK family protein [Actinophytocola sp.]
MPANRAHPDGLAAGRGEVFQLLRDGRPRTRAELAAETGLARSTIAERIERLLASGLLRPTDKAGSTGGRPPTMFSFNPTARVVLAADIGATHARVALTDLTGDVLAEDETKVDLAVGPEAVLGYVADTCQGLLARTGRSPGDLLGIGVGLPGPVEHSTGRPVIPPIMPGWDGFDVKGHLRDHLGVQTLVDNDVNLMALGEHKTHWPDSPNMIFVKVATGIGSGLISDGRLHRGSRGSAGDMGHVQVPHGADVPCRCGNLGCLEAVASGAAIAARLTAAGIPASTSSEVVALARTGSVDAVQQIRQAGRDIGEVLATAVSLFNPSVIVVGGSLSQAGEHLIAGVREVVYRRSLPLATTELRIVQSRAGNRAGVVGAATMVIDHALSPVQLDALL